MNNSNGRRWFRSSRSQRRKRVSKKLNSNTKRSSTGRESLSNTNTNYHIVDANNNKDVLFADTEGYLVYPWYSLSVAEVSGILNVKRKINQKKVVRISTLKELCIEHLALNATNGGLTSNHLYQVPWNSCAKHLWNRILQLQTDSFAVFLVFYTIYGRNLDFLSHWTSSNTGVETLWETRQFALNVCSVGISRRHRIENVFSNIDYDTFTEQLNQLEDTRVVLDISRCQLSMTHLSFLRLLKINLLWAFDASHSQLINDNILRLLARAPGASELLSSLRVLNIRQCPNVTADGLRALLMSPHTNLAYVESDIPLPLVPFHARYALGKPYVVGTKWICLDTKSEEYGSLKRAFAFASTSLPKRFPNSIPRSTKNEMVLDMIILEDNISVQLSLISKLMSSWDYRRQLSSVSKRTMAPFVYVNEHSVNKTNSDPISVTPMARKVQKAKRIVKRKPKTAKEYFGL